MSVAIPAVITDLEKLKPLNIDIITLDQDVIRQMGLREIKNLDIFNKGTGNFHEDGLFSTEIFGKPLSKSRTSTFAYIDLRVDVLHPLAYKMLTRMSAFYKGVLEGKRYAIFDEVSKDLVEVDADHEEADTGYKFFMDSLPRISLKKNKSRKRNAYIDYLYKNRLALTLRYLLVLPAGQRDYTVDDTGKPSEDDINGLYRKLLYAAQSIGPAVTDKNEYLYDSNRLAIQNALMNLYNYILSLLSGKSKLVLGKWGSRRVYISSRNVITPSVPNIPVLGGPKTTNSNRTTVGLFQYCKTIFPLFYNSLKTGVLSHVFLDNQGRAKLIDKKSLQSVDVTVAPRQYDSYMNYTEFEKLFNSYANTDLRDRPVVVADHYLALIHDSGKEVRVVLDPSQHPELDPKLYSPITYTQLYYLYAYDLTDRTPAFVTRYPVAGYGSIYPSYPYLKVADRSKTVTVFDVHGAQREKPAIEYPLSTLYFDSISPASSALGRLGADFDGDTVSFSCVMTDDAVEEIETLLSKRSYYVTGSNQVYFGLIDDVVELSVMHLTSNIQAPA